MPLESINYSSLISIDNIPAQWLSKIELYYPELPNFPTIYIHKHIKGQRVYAFPVSIRSVYPTEDNLLTIEFEILSNIDLDNCELIKEYITDELKERIGASDKISRADVMVMSGEDVGYRYFFDKLWDFIEPVYGTYIPYGKFYEEVYSMVRFVSAFQPKTGRQSEMRMLYNFMSIFGEKIEVSINGCYSFCDFFLIPNYTDLLEESFDDFPKFKKLFVAMEKVYNLSFTSSFAIAENDALDTLIKCQERAFPKTKSDFIEKNLNYWLQQNLITNDDKFYIERLVDAFNRFPWRAAFFISSIFIAYEKDYRAWNKDFFISFYEKAGKGISQKVIACFVQQGFKNASVIPIDTWIESFCNGALNIDNNNTFFSTFEDMGKLERVIWLSSQANKTNIRQFFNTLWCCRYGVNNNERLRSQNPLACYECALRDACKGYNNIKNKEVYVTNEPVTNRSFINENVVFVCKTEDNVPKLIYIKDRRGEVLLIDEFSGYLLKNNRTAYNNVSITVEDFLNSINPAYDTSSFDLLQNGEF